MILDYLGVLNGKGEDDDDLLGLIDVPFCLSILAWTSDLAFKACALVEFKDNILS